MNPNVITQIRIYSFNPYILPAERPIIKFIFDQIQASRSVAGGEPDTEIGQKAPLYRDIANLGLRCFYNGGMAGGLTGLFNL